MFYKIRGDVAYYYRHIDQSNHLISLVECYDSVPYLSLPFLSPQAMSQVLGSPSEEDKLRLAVLEGQLELLQKRVLDTVSCDVKLRCQASSSAESAGKREGGVETESEVAGKAVDGW